jgi:ABC-2 type transport system permease protein
MWFRNVYLKTLREFRVGIFGWGIGTGLLIYIVLASFPSLVTTAQARASLVALAQSFNWLSAPIAVDTPGGYATFKYGGTILLIGIWALSTGSRVLRGEEEQGRLDVLLSVPESRLRLAIEKLAAIWTALLAMGLLIALITYVGGTRALAGYAFGEASLFALNIVLTCAVFAGLALFISQFTQERGTAAGLTGALFVLAILLDMVHRVIKDTEWISQLSPVYYYNLNKPLVPGWSVNLLGYGVLLGSAIVLSAAAVYLFVRRDVGGTVPLPFWLRLPQRPPSKKLPVGEWSLQSLYGRSLAMVARPSAWWTVGIAGFAVWMVVIVKQTEAQLVSIAASSPFFKQVMSALGGSSVVGNSTILSALFFFLPVGLMAYAVVQTNRWAADEEEGRLELVLATPQSRLGVLFARYGALTTAVILIGIVTLLATWLTSSLEGVKLDGSHVTAASLGMIPLGLLVAALGYFFAGWLRTAIDTGLLSLLVAAWVFISLLGPDLKFPEGVLRVSPLYYYGTPLLNGLNAVNTAGLLLVAAAALALASARFASKDLR